MSASIAPKGRNIPAQGNTLGAVAYRVSALKGRNKRGIGGCCFALSGLDNLSSRHSQGVALS
jgi:hypothetical protein